MAIANEEYRTFYDCGDCGYFYFTTDTDTYYTECPVCGPAAKRKRKLLQQQEKIRSLNRQLQEGIYE